MKIKQYRKEINKCIEELKIYKHEITAIVNYKGNDYRQKKIDETYGYLKKEQSHISFKIWILQHQISMRENFQELIKSRYNFLDIEWEMNQFDDLNKALEYLEEMEKNSQKDRYDQIFKDRKGMAFSMTKIDKYM